MRWAAFAFLYLLFAGHLDPVEFGIAVVLATLESVCRLRSSHLADPQFSPAADHVACWGRALAQLVPSTFEVGTILARAALWGSSPGRARRVPFARGPERDPNAAGRRATAILATSLAPDSFVVRAEPGRDEVLIHTILPDAGARDAAWLS